MTTFFHAFVTKWKDGQVADWKDATIIVSYDQTNHAYRIKADEREAFADWVATHWPRDDAFQEDGESNAAFLDRCDITIREVWLDTLP